MPLAARPSQSSLQHALTDVHATLTELLVVADQQFPAVTADDRPRLEAVTRRQEELSARLARDEARRIELTGAEPLSVVLAAYPKTTAGRLEAQTASIAAAIRALKDKNTQTASLLEQSSALAEATLDFLQRLVSSHMPAYGSHGLVDPRFSLLVDSHA